MNAKRREELVELAAEIILDALRDESQLPFHRNSIHQAFSSKWFKGVCDEKEISGREQVAIARDAISRLTQRCPSLLVTLGANDELHHIPPFSLSEASGVNACSSALAGHGTSSDEIQEREKLPRF